MRTEPTTVGTSLNGGKPVIRWAGGKRLIVPRLLDFLPKTYGTYFEPMVGSGALFFALRPKNAVLADVNSELINFYTVIKNKPNDFFETVRQIRASKKTYYRLRESCPSSALERAARFFYLVRLSWNGLYRVNRQGQYNVPFGGRNPKNLVTLDAILDASRALENACLTCGDFGQTTREAKSGDLVYLDPPYPKGAADGNGFDRYSETKFTLEDHKRLARIAAALADRGVHVLITEASRKEIVSLYSDAFYRKCIRTSSLIAADSRRRRDTYEVVLTSCRTDGLYF